MTNSLQEFLGDIVIRCRLRRFDAVLGIVEVLQLLIVVPMMAFFPCSIPAILLVEALGAKKPLWDDPIGMPIVGIWWAACCVLIVSAVIALHRRNHLQLREGGIVHNRRAFRFNEIFAICPGRQKSTVEKLFPTLSGALLVASPGALAARLEADLSVFSLLLRNGSAHAVYEVPKLYERDDVMAFFAELNQRQPQCFVPME